MLPSKLSIVALVVALAAISLHSVDAGRTFVSSSSISFLRSQERTSLLLRGGASAVLEDQDDVSEIESSDYEEDEEDDLVKSARSTIVKKTKKAVAASLAATKPKKKKTSIVKLLRIPYILGACLNPAIVVQMIKGYWASLFNVNYLKDNTDQSENLRSALQEKSKKGGGSSPRGKRKMKPGQAKTLSDLPQLNT